MNKVKLLGIAPYAGMKELMQGIAERRNDIDLEIFVGDLSAGVDIALEHQGRGFSGIVSRGGTADMIKLIADIPVSEVTLSVYDVLRAIKLAQSYEGKFAIVGFPSITKCSKLLCDLLQYKIDIVTIKSQDEVASCLEMLKEQGCSLVLGDMVTITNAKLAGINGILITSGGESIESAFDHAIEICEGRRKNLEKIDFLDSLLRSMKDEIIVFRENGELIFSTSNTSDKELISFMKKNIQQVQKSGEKKILRRNGNGNLIALLGRSFSAGGAKYCSFSITYSPLRQSIYDGQGVVFQNKMELLEDVDNIFSKSNSISRVTGIIEKYCRSDFPILLMGECGTGKDKTANSIYVHSKLGDNPMISIDCETVTEKKWDQLLDDEYSPFADEKLTIYIKNMDQLSHSLRARLIKYFKESDICKKNRVIFSFVTRHGESVDDAFCSQLRHDLSCLVLGLRPLRQRPGDIPSLCSLYINEINAATGKQVIGVTSEAMELLQEYHWERNINQLKRVLTELVVLSDTPYISASDVSETLAAEGGQKPEPMRYDLNLNQSLEGITKDIAMMILKEEEMNQSKAARRLQISRSKLWRMMKG
ncbi:MAG: PrpR N-terminal domain-containing protein [Holosporales bacterium]|jgi:transcriptional regulator with PAS, ATPase and Fis domain|nr:PrpR N-terminal domain-containing protein [Holosporales bacterium]